MKFIIHWVLILEKGLPGPDIQCVKAPAKPVVHCDTQQAHLMKKLAHSVISVTSQEAENSSLDITSNDSVQENLVNCDVAQEKAKAPVPHFQFPANTLDTRIEKRIDPIFESKRKIGRPHSCIFSQSQTAPQVGEVINSNNNVQQNLVNRDVAQEKAKAPVPYFPLPANILATRIEKSVDPIFEDNRTIEQPHLCILPQSEIKPEVVDVLPAHPIMFKSSGIWKRKDLSTSESEFFSKPQISRLERTKTLDEILHNGGHPIKMLPITLGDVKSLNVSQDQAEKANVDKSDLIVKIMAKNRAEVEERLPLPLDGSRTNVRKENKSKTIDYNNSLNVKSSDEDAANDQDKPGEPSSPTFPIGADSRTEVFVEIIAKKDTGITKSLFVPFQENSMRNGKNENSSETVNQDKSQSIVSANCDAEKAGLKPKQASPQVKVPDGIVEDDTKKDGRILVGQKRAVTALVVEAAENSTGNIEKRLPVPLEDFVTYARKENDSNTSDPFLSLSMKLTDCHTKGYVRIEEPLSQTTFPASVDDMTRVVVETAAEKSTSTANNLCLPPQESFLTNESTELNPLTINQDKTLNVNSADYIESTTQKSAQSSPQATVSVMVVKADTNGNIELSPTQKAQMAVEQSPPFIVSGSEYVSEEAVEPPTIPITLKSDETFKGIWKNVQEDEKSLPIDEAELPTDDQLTQSDETMPSGDDVSSVMLDHDIVDSGELLPESLCNGKMLEDCAVRTECVSINDPLRVVKMEAQNIKKVEKSLSLPVEDSLTNSQNDLKSETVGDSNSLQFKSADSNAKNNAQENTKKPCLLPASTASIGNGGVNQEKTASQEGEKPDQPRTAAPQVSSEVTKDPPAKSIILKNGKVLKGILKKTQRNILCSPPKRKTEISTKTLLNQLEEPETMADNAPSAKSSQANGYSNEFLSTSFRDDRMLEDGQVQTDHASITETNAEGQSSQEKFPAGVDNTTRVIAETYAEKSVREERLSLPLQKQSITNKGKESELQTDKSLNQISDDCDADITDQTSAQPSFQASVPVKIAESDTTEDIEVTVVEKKHIEVEHSPSFTVTLSDVAPGEVEVPPSKPLIQKRGRRLKGVLKYVQTDKKRIPTDEAEFFCKTRIARFEETTPSGDTSLSNSKIYFNTMKSNPLTRSVNGSHSGEGDYVSGRGFTRTHRTLVEYQKLISGSLDPTFSTSAFGLTLHTDIQSYDFCGKDELAATGSISVKVSYFCLAVVILYIRNIDDFIVTSIVEISRWSWPDEILKI